MVLTLVDWNVLKHPLERLASAKTGRSVTISGRLDAHVWSWTPLRTPDERLIVLPNALAASQTLVNFNSTFAPWPLTVAIRLSREAEIAAARELAMRVAREQPGKASVIGCFVTRVDSAGVSLELRLRAPTAAARDELRNQLLEALPRQFEQAKIGVAANDLPCFISP